MTTNCFYLNLLQECRAGKRLAGGGGGGGGSGGGGGGGGGKSYG